MTSVRTAIARLIVISTATHISNESKSNRKHNTAMGYVHIHVHVDNIMCSTRQEPNQEYSRHDNDHNNT